MVDQLPETSPHKNKKKFEAFDAALAFQIVLVAGVTQPRAHPRSQGRPLSLNSTHPVEKTPEVIAPTAIPKDIARKKYEPTYLNGQAVPVILTARITFSLSRAEK